MLKFEAGVVRQVRDIFFASSNQVVDANHLVAFGKQGVAKMRAKKARAAGTRARIYSAFPV